MRISLIKERHQQLKMASHKWRVKHLFDRTSTPKKGFIGELRTTSTENRIVPPNIVNTVVISDVLVLWETPRNQAIDIKMPAYNIPDGQKSKDVLYVSYLLLCRSSHSYLNEIVSVSWPSHLMSSEKPIAAEQHKDTNRNIHDELRFEPAYTRSKGYTSTSSNLYWPPFCIPPHQSGLAATLFG